MNPKPLFIWPLLLSCAAAFLSGCTDRPDDPLSRTQKVCGERGISKYEIGAWGGVRFECGKPKG